MYQSQPESTNKHETKKEYSVITKMSELQEAYREFLNEVHPEVTIAGCTFEPSEVLEKLDPIAFRQSYLDYADAEGIDIDELEDDL